MTKIVINTGAGFDLTHNAIMRYAELKGLKLTAYLYHYNLQSYYEQRWYARYNPDNADEKQLEEFIHYFINTDAKLILDSSNMAEQFYPCSIDRTDPSLIQTVSELKDSEHLDLKIVEVPDEVKWEIIEDERGPEYVREVSRVWN